SDCTPSYATIPVWKGVNAASTDLPQRTEVVIIGGGISGVRVAQGLRNHGVQVHILEQRTNLGGGMATRGMGICTPLLLDPPFRLISAVGLGVAREIVGFTTENLDIMRDHLEPTGVIYASKGIDEAQEVEKNLEALVSLEIPATPWTSSVMPDIGPGWHQPRGGVLQPEAILRDWSEGVSVSLSTSATSITDEGSDLIVHTDSGQSIRADMVVMTGGAQITPWADDKFHTIRHQAVATSPTGPHLSTPMHIQYGYTSARQLDTGELLVSGCRWATPHLEVGETDDTVIHPSVDRRLCAFLGQHFPDPAQAGITHRWTGIMTSTCDGLPIIGPLPGRPRIIACGGFGGFSWSLAPRAAQAVVEGIITGKATGVPACFSTRRFD
ncbi:MAG: NAD(P)/FAD-dependent oxidoreductase, partial [Myxococcota bacterium]